MEFQVRYYCRKRYFFFNYYFIAQTANPINIRFSRHGINLRQLKYLNDCFITDLRLQLNSTDIIITQLLQDFITPILMTLSL